MVISAYYLFLLSVRIAWVQALLVGSYKNRITPFNHHHATSYIMTLWTQLDPDSIHNLDLDLILQDVSQYTVTRRGKDAFLYLAGVIPSARSTPSSSSRLSNRVQSRKTFILSSLRHSSSPPTILDNVLNTTSSATTTTVVSHLIPIAQTLGQARAEYHLVREALLLLQSTTSSFSSFGSRNLYENKTIMMEINNTFLAEIPRPPMYDAGLPSNRNTNSFLNDDDYDEWLYHIMRYGITETLTLENILQAEQMVGMALRTCTWATQYELEARLPGLYSILSLFPVSILELLHEGISKAVVIVQGEKSYLDPLGTKSYKFQLNQNKFPQLRLLIQREKRLRQELKIEDFQYLDPKGEQKGSRKSNELKNVQEEIDSLETTITHNLWGVIAKHASSIHQSLEILARLDTIFARALYALERGGTIPFMDIDGQIQVDNFIHPVLSSPLRRRGNQMSSTVVPIQLLLPRHHTTQRGLVITGSNGGGKTLALKSFGIVATISKLGIPILVSTKSRPRDIRVDFFYNIFTQVGDDQDVLQGVSTLTARLSEYARILERTQSRISSSEDDNASFTNHSLILLDELGTGTDQNTGGALAQAILENLLEQKWVRTVVTTHSPRIKSMSLLDKRMDCATVCLDDNEFDDSSISKIDTVTSLRSFKLQYGIVGESNGLRAAKRCIPKLPTSVIDRAQTIMNEDTNRDDQTEALKQSAFREKEITTRELQEASLYKEKAAFSWISLEKVARTYENKFKRMELRLESIFQTMKDESPDSMFTVLGATLAEIRLMKKSVETLTSTLQDRGLMPIPINYIFRPGEKVVILAKGPWEGEMASVSNESSDDDHILVDISCDWMDPNDVSFLNSTTQQHSFLKNELAMWNFPTDDDVPRPVAIIQKSTDRLMKLLSTLPLEKKTSTATNQSKRKNDEGSYKRKSASKRKK